MRQRVTDRQSRAQRIAAQPPAFCAKRTANVFERRHVRIGMVGSCIGWGIRTAVPEQLDHHRPTHLRKRIEIRQPLRARHQKTMHQQQMWAGAAVRFEMQLVHGVELFARRFLTESPS